MRIAIKSFVVLMAAMLAVLTSAHGVSPCLGQDATVRKNQLPADRFRALTVGEITKTARHTVYVDPGMCGLSTDGTMYVRANAPARTAPFVNPWEFASVKLTVAFDSKEKKVRILDLDMSAEEFTYCPRANNGKDTVDLTDATKSWVPAEQVTSSKGKGPKLDSELWGARIWEIRPSANAWVSAKLIRVSEDGKGWVDGGIGVRRFPFKDGAGPAARVVVSEKLTFCDLDLSEITHRFEWKGAPPEQTYVWSKEEREKAGDFSLQLVTIMPVRQWILPRLPPEPAGKVTVNSDLPDRK
jgi:hypothetical protein